MAPLIKLGTEAGRSPAYLENPSDLLNPEELAARLKVKKSWVLEQTRTRANVRNPNPFPFKCLGKYPRFSWREVCQWLESCPKKPPQKRTRKSKAQTP
jgi:hypothetical protein